MMNLPEPTEVTPRIAPRAPEKLSPADKDAKTGPLDLEQTEDPSFVEELALAIGAVLPSQIQSLLPWTPPETSTDSRDSSKQGISLEARPETQSVASVPVFFALPPQEVKVQPTEQMIQASTPLSPPAVPQWVAGEVRRFEQEGKTMTQLSIPLDPPDLGKLQLTLTMVDKKVAVEIHIQAQAKPHLEDSLLGIRQILASHNLSTKEVKVTTSSNPQNRSQQDAYPQQNRWARRRSSEDDSMTVKA